MNDHDVVIRQLTKDVAKWKNRAMEMVSEVCIRKCGGICREEEQKDCMAFRIRIEAATDR